MNLSIREPSTLAKLVGITSDIALVIDAAGVIKDVSLKPGELAGLPCHSWVGKRWEDTVRPDSRVKVADMLRNAGESEIRWRHINHPTSQNDVDYPIQYALIRMDADAGFLAVGRDLEAVAALQRRLVETQQSMERDYLRLRHIETRYRVLFDTTTDAVLLVDASSQRILELNQSSQSLLKDPSKRLVGKEVMDAFEPSSREEIQSLLRMTHATGRVEMRKARFLGAAVAGTVSATVFRQESGAQFLIRLLPQENSVADLQTGSDHMFQAAVELAPDGFLITDRAGLIKSANAEMMSMLGATSTSQLVGKSLEQWFVRGGVDWGVLSTSLKQQTNVKDFATNLMTFSGQSVAVEIAAVTLPEPGAESSYGFFIRDLSRRQPVEVSESAGMSDSVAQLAKLVGRLPMKDIVGETADMIEKMCIRSALDLTHNNRASAAEMLGLSRQSLYVKLRRYGMVSDLEVEQP